MAIYIVRDSLTQIPIGYFQNKRVAKKEARAFKRAGVDVRVSRPIPAQALGLPTGRRQLTIELQKLNASLDLSWQALP